MSSTNSDDLSAEKPFDWNKYLIERNAEEVPEDFFHHVCKSELNGIEVGSVVEIENEDQSGYWFASVCSSKGVLINLHYFGDENDKHDFWLEVKSSRIHSLNWGSDNNKKLLPPYPDGFSRVNPKTIKEKVEDCENIVSNSVLQMKGAPIYNIFKPEMLIEVQDKEYPYRVWISKILKNVGGRLFLKMQGVLSPEKKPFWLFYLNERIFPLGWAEQKGLPWRVMNLDGKFEDNLESSFLLNVLKPKTPKQHSYKVGEMLEVINPYSLMVFYVATIVKIYDNRYFKVEVDNDNDIEKRITFVATKENPYLFNGGWASKHKFLLKPPSDWKTPNTFCWSTYISMKGAKFANVDNVCRKKIDRIHVGMKLEAVDPIETDRIRVATIKGFTDHWMILSFDRTQWCGELLHVRSVYSDDVFPVGWCNKHKYSLSTPKLPFTDCDDYKTMYYASDIDIDFNQSDNNYLEKYPNFVKGEIFYHYSKKNDYRFEDELEESIQNILNEDCINNANVSKFVNKKLNNFKPVKNIKAVPPELDEELHEAISLEEKVVKEIDLEKIKENSSEICIYFNKNCYSGGHILKKKKLKLPKVIGPGPVSTTLKLGITLLINSDYHPGTALKKLKNIQNMLFNGPGGVNMLIISKANKSYSRTSEYLLLPDSKNMAQFYCSALCNLSGMCENFMNTEQIECPHCEVKEKLSSKSKSKKENKQIVSNSMKATRTKATKPPVLINSDCSEKHLTLNNKIVKVGSKSKSKMQSMSLRKNTKKTKVKSPANIISDCSPNNLNEEINQVGSKKLEIDTKPSRLKVTRNRTKLSDSINSDSFRNSLTYSKEIHEVETKLRSKKVANKRTKPAAAAIDSSCSEDQLTLHEEIIKIFQSDPGSIKVISKRTNKRAKPSVFINSDGPENNLSINEEINLFEAKPSSMKVTRQRTKPSDSINSSGNNVILSEEIPQVGTKTNLKTESSIRKVIRKRAKPSILLNSHCSENNLTLNEEIDQFETKPRSIKVSRKRAKPAASIDSDCFEDQGTLNEEMSKVFEANRSSMRVAKKRYKPTVSIDSDRFENQFTVKEDFNKEFGSKCMSKIDTLKLKPINTEIAKNMAMVTISIDSDSSENNFTLIEEIDEFETKESSLKVARETHEKANFISSIDYNCSENNFNVNEENNPFETNPRSMKVARKKTKSTVSTDSDSSENNLTCNENTYRFDSIGTKASSLNVARKTREMAISMVSIDSDSSENRSTLNEKFNKESELKHMNIEVGRNIEMANIIEIDSDCSEDNFTLIEEINETDTNVSLNVARKTTEWARSTSSIDSECSENNFIQNKENNQSETDPWSMKVARKRTISTVSINSDFSENNLTYNIETNQYEAMTNNFKVARKPRDRAKDNMSSTDSDSSENRFTLNEKFIKGSAKSKIDTLELKPMNEEVSRNMEMVTFPIDSDCSEKSFILVEEINECDAKASSLNVARKNRDCTKSMYTIDSDSSENNLTYNIETNQYVYTIDAKSSSLKFARTSKDRAKYNMSSTDSDSSENRFTLNEKFIKESAKSKIDTLELKPSNEEVSRNMTMATISIDSDSSENSFILIEDIEELDKTDAKASSLNTARKTRERAKSMSFIDSYSFKKWSTLNEEFNRESDTLELEPVNIEVARNVTRATISIDSDSSENNFTLVEDNEELETPWSMQVARKKTKSTVSIDPDCSENNLTYNEETNEFETDPQSMKVVRKRTKSTVSTDSDSSENNLTYNEETNEFESKPSKIKFDRTRPLSSAAYYSDYSERSSTQDEEITQYDLESTSCIKPNSTEPNSMHHIMIDLNNLQSLPLLIHEISRIAEAVLDWSNAPLVKRYYYYMASIVNFEAHILKLNQNFTNLEVSIISEIQSIKSHLSVMDEIDIYSNTKSDIDRSDQDIIISNDWRSVFENFYRQDLRFKKYKVDIGHFKPLRVTSNPKFWSPKDVHKYLSSDLYCTQIARKLYLEELDGVGFMLLNEEQLLKYLRCKINVAIRLMCHIAEAKYIYFKKYNNI